MKSNTFRTILILLFCWPMVQLSGQTFPNSPTGFYHRTATGGNWNQTSTWGNQTVPGTGQSVRIPQGVTVVVTNLNSAEVKFIRVEGTLIFRPTLNTKLTAETIYIASQGKLRMGTATRPIAVNRTAEIVFSNSGPAFNTIWDAREISRGLISDGQVVIAGSAKTNRVECDNSIQLGQTSINLHLPAPTNWRVNDELAIAGTQFKQGTHHSDEIVRFLSKGATQINLQGSTPIQKPHLRVRTDMNLHIANLTRNVILRSESASPIKARGHAMFRAGSDVDIRYASFIDLGRTDKTRALNERIITVNGTGTGQFTNIPGDSTNRRGRYSVHFHMNGPGPNVNKPTASVIGCVVRGTPGWGFVNHSSNVFFKDNICYDFKGAGFVTEAG
ncbi:MAG TPA: hypothetical protein ENJ82_03855, partial [Bacteroidetes bacterium]|nr:hypothetical protein [Bacteroidota bacterium]